MSWHCSRELPPRHQACRSLVELTGQPKKLFCVVSPSAAATLSPLRPPCSSPHCAGCFPPAPASPHSPALLAPLRRARLKPPLGRPLARPLRGLPCPVPQGAALRAAVDDPRSASRRSGDGRPRFGHSPAAGAAWRGLRRGLAIPRPAVTPSASTAGLRVELARPAAAGLARLRLGRCPRRSRGPVPAFGRSGGCRTARVRSGGGPPAFLPRRRTCRKVPRPETGRPRHARIAVAAGSPPRQ